MLAGRRCLIASGLVAALAGCGAASRTTTVTRTTTVPRTTAVGQPPKQTTANQVRAGPPVPESVIATADKSISPVDCERRNANQSASFLGTAFAVGRDEVVTASHVVASCANRAIVSLGGATATVIEDEPTHDLALMSVSGYGFGYQPSILQAEERPPWSGEHVALLGLPNGGVHSSLTATPGAIVGVNRHATLVSREGFRETLSDAIEVTASGVVAGESGGPAINAAGKVVGVIEGSGNGVVYLTPASDLPRHVPAGLPVLTAGPWSGVKPSTIDFSADSGNVVTGINWTSWTATAADGKGTSGIQNCVPNCAAGTIRYVPTRLSLSDPQQGRFTQIIETRAGANSTWSYPSGSWPLGAS